MSTQEPGRAPQMAALTSLPSLEEIPQVEGGGLDPQRVKDAFDSFRRHALQLQAQLRVLQAAGKSANVEPTGHAVRMDALHLIRAAAEFADALERDAQAASAAQMGRAEEEIRRGQRELQDREAEVERYRDESERQRAEVLNAAKAEARDLLTNAHRDATGEMREAEARASRLLEQSRHQATELTNSARAEVEQTLEWARQQSGAIMNRAQQGAEQLLSAAGLGPDAMADVVDAIVRAADAVSEAQGGRPRRPADAVAGAAAPAAPRLRPRRAGRRAGGAGRAGVVASEPESSPPFAPPPVSQPPASAPEPEDSQPSPSEEEQSPEDGDAPRSEDEH